MSDNCLKFQLGNLPQNNTSETDIFDLNTYILEKGKSAFLFDDFDFESFITKTTLFLQENLDRQIENFEENDNFIKIHFSSQKSRITKLNLNETFTLVFYKENNSLKFAVLPYSLIQGEKKRFNLSSVVNSSYDKKIGDFIYDYIYKEYLNFFPQKKSDFENKFIENIEKEQFVLLHEVLGDETLLGKLDIQSAKNRISSEKAQDFADGFFVLGENRVFILFQNKNNDLTECLAITELDINKRMLLKNVITVDKYKLSPKRINTDLFSSLANILDFKGDMRIRKFAEINFNLGNYIAAKNFYRLLSERNSNPYDIFLFLLSAYKLGKEDFERLLEENDLQKIINDFLRLEDAEQKLASVFKLKTINFKDQTSLLNILAETVNEDKDSLKIISPFYDAHRKKFLKKNKEAIDRTVFDIRYAEFLKKSGKNRKAKSVLNNLLKHLPDESVSGLVPNENLNWLSDKSGPLLKITVLDLLAEIKGKENASAEIKKMAYLQPLNEKRIEKLLSVKDKAIRSRAEAAYAIFKGNEFSAEDKDLCTSDYTPLPDSLINKRIRHTSFTKKTTLYSFQKWISKIAEEDYFALKNYSERVRPEEHGELFRMLSNTFEVFGLNNVEFFISKGERNKEIIGYEGNPPFLLIGSVFLDETSPFYMNMNELQYAVAAEAAHIYFKHTKLTSKDVWRGLVSKGSLFADTALTLIPAAGFLTKNLKNIPKLNLLTNLFQHTASGIAGGKTAYETAMRFSEYYGKKEKPGEEKQNNLIAVSRLMQYTADRAGLLLCGNLKSAVKNVLLSQDFENNPFDEIEKTSLKEFLLKQNSDGTYKNNKTAARIANLYSFWFSEDYELLRKALEKKK